MLNQTALYPVFALMAASSVCFAADDPGSATVLAQGQENLAVKLDRHLQHWHESGRFNGVTLVAVGDSVVFVKGYGQADRALQIPHGPETRFDIRSISKQFTCVLILQLAAEGKLDLDASLHEYLPEYRPDTGREVTIDQLLRHTSGIPCFLNDSHLRQADRPRFDPTAEYTATYFLTEFLSEDLMFPPGERYSYCNTAYYLLASVAERVTGLPFNELVHERLLVPTGMSDSGLLFACESVDNFAVGYVRSPWGYRVCDPWRPEYFVGSGGMYATAGDLFRWSRALHAGELLSPEWLRFMREPYTHGPPPDHAYAINHFTMRRPGLDPIPYTGFSGGGQGYCSDVMRFGDGDVTVVLLDNTSQYNHWQIAPEIVGIVYGRQPPVPRPLLVDKLLVELRSNGWRSALGFFQGLGPDDDAYVRDGLERDLNTSGYSALHIDNELAVEIFRLNAALFPDSWNTHDSLGEGLAAAGLSQESASSYETARFLHDRTRRLLAALREGHWDDARTLIAAARDSNPDARPLKPAQIGPLVEEAIAGGEFARARHLVDIWSEAAPETVGPWFTLARILRATGDTSGLRNCYRRIIAIDPDNDRARRYLQEIGEAE